MLISLQVLISAIKFTAKFVMLQDSSFNPGAGEKVSFRVATHLATAKAAQKAAAPNSKYAGNLSSPEIQEIAS